MPYKILNCIYGSCIIIICKCLINNPVYLVEFGNDPFIHWIQVGFDFLFAGICNSVFRLFIEDMHADESESIPEFTDEFVAMLDVFPVKCHIRSWNTVCSPEP